MSEQYAVFLEQRHRGDGEDDRRRVTVQRLARVRGGSRPELVLQILGADQSATEFLSREQFEDLVTNARRVMAWEGEKLVVEDHPTIEFADGGQAMITELECRDCPISIRLISWEETKGHPQLKKLAGDVPTTRRGETITGNKKLRITIEAI